ncbi:MAG: serine/threonine protein kinase, partial [Deltaproteobacteria bacterium]|nr:serine/threonine protein kinase [Deltaproteobacteria bacterium]
MPAVEDPLAGVPRPGDVVGGKYRVEGLLGAGGMGAVVAATHLQLDQPVAIKFLLAKAAQNPNSFARFTREARAAAKIGSEHVARVTDVGALPDGTPYMVMERLQGEDLGQCLRRGPLPVAEAVDYLLQAAEALAEAHAAGIVHRDLKPENLFLAKRADGSKHVKVLDFGISKILAEAAGAGPTPNLTQTAAVIGSPLYMAPEQMRSARQADTRTDIWALGAILYELVSGESPFSATTMPEVCVKILQDSPPPLRGRVAGASPEFDAVIACALAKSPEERFPNLGAMAEALLPLGGESAARSAEFIRGVLAAAATAPRAEQSGAGADSSGPVAVPVSSWAAGHEATAFSTGAPGAAPLPAPVPVAGAGGWGAVPVYRAGAVSTATPVSHTAGAAPVRRPGRIWAVAIGALLAGLAAGYVGLTAVRKQADAGGAAAGPSAAARPPAPTAAEPTALAPRTTALASASAA